MHSWMYVVFILMVTQCQCHELGLHSWFCLSGNEFCDCFPNNVTAMCSCSVVLDGITEEKFLHCSYRNITTLEKQLMLPQDLVYFDLSGNNFSDLEDMPFRQPHPLKGLILKENNFKNLSENFLEGLTSLETLDLSRNLLEKLPDNLLKNKCSLRTLNLSENNLEYLPGQLFNNVIKIDTLSISGNKRIFLNISMSKDALNDAFRKGLSTLDISHMNLTYIPKSLFEELISLQKLDISYNPLTSVFHIYIGSLQVLYMRGTNISVIESGSFLTFPNLQFLYLDDSPILKSVEKEAFVGLEKLKELSLERCTELTIFSELAFGGPNSTKQLLDRFSLANGSFNTLPESLLPFLQDVKVVELYGNPWYCNCYLKWIKGLNFTEENKEHARCRYPKCYRNDTLFSVYVDNLICSREVLQDKIAVILIWIFVWFCVAIGFVGPLFRINIGKKVSKKQRRERRQHQQQQQNQVDHFGGAVSGPSGIMAHAAVAIAEDVRNRNMMNDETRRHYVAKWFSDQDDLDGTVVS